MRAARAIAVDRARRSADPAPMSRTMRAFRLSTATNDRLVSLNARHGADHTRIIEAAVLALTRLSVVAQRAVIAELDEGPYGGATASLLELLTARGPMTRAQLTTALRAPKGTVDAAVKRLTDDEVIAKEDNYGGRLYVVARGKPKP